MYSSKCRNCGSRIYRSHRQAGAFDMNTYMEASNIHIVEVGPTSDNPDDPDDETKEVHVKDDNDHVNVNLYTVHNCLSKKG